MRALADDCGLPAGLRRGDVSDHSRDAEDQELSSEQGGAAAVSPALRRRRRDRFAGALALGAVFSVMVAGIVSISGYNALTMSGVYLGTFVGIISLVIEIAVVGRSLRLFAHNGMQVTMQTFIMRLALVGGIGMWCMREASRTDAQAFCLTYCATFFVYMCWLTWRTYHQPIQYQPKPTRKKAKKPCAVAEAMAAVKAAGETL